VCFYYNVLPSGCQLPSCRFAHTFLSDETCRRLIDDPDAAPAAPVGKKEKEEKEEKEEEEKEWKEKTETRCVRVCACLDAWFGRVCVREGESHEWG
jgi:hypothetical protein